MSTPFQVTVGTLPPGTCFTTPQALAQLFASILQITWTETDSLFNYGPTTPTSDKQDRPWIHTDANFVFDRIYTFVNGQWISPHYMNPGFTMEYKNPSTGKYDAAMSSQSFFDTIDGGSAGAVTTTSGPFWLLDTTSGSQGRFHWQVDVPGQTAYPVGKEGPQPDDVEGLHAGSGSITNVPYVIVPVIYRSNRLYYTIPAA